MTIGTLTGPLQAQNGLVSATTSIGVKYGGTGLTSNAAYGQLLLGQTNGTYALTATSSLGLLGSGFTNWKVVSGYLTPTTTMGIITLASSTIQYLNSASSTLGTTLITGNATTSGALYIGGSTTTAANGIQLSAGCFRNPAGTCVGGGKESTYVVAAQNSTNKAYADYVAAGAGAETAINTALQAAYAGGRGGKVYLMEGDYYLSTGAGDKIQMATSTSLIGAGQSTVIHIASSTNATANAIVANTLSYITIAHFFIY